MIVPINIGVREYQSGQKVLLIKEINCTYVMFTIGHEFTVIEKNKSYRTYRLKDEETGIIIKDVYPDSFTLKTDLQEAKTICTDIREKNKTIEFIKSRCPHKGEGFYDRDTYESCQRKSNRSYQADECTCNLSCINYIKKEEIDKNSFIKTYMRKIKIKEITK